MSKRFINPNWKALRKLSAELRQCYFYCWDKCDAAGVYEYDPAYMEADLGFKLSFDELLKLPYVKHISDEKFLFADFIEVNNGGVLKDSYNPHKPIFRAIKFHGPEFFEDLDLKIESGTKEEKKLEDVKTFFKLENKKTKLENNFSKLVDEGVDEGEGEDKTEGGSEGTMLVPEMLQVWKKQKPNYPEEKLKDFQALRHIAQFICKQQTISFQPREPDVRKMVLEAWAALVLFISGDSFYNSKSLTSVSFNIQSISMSIQNAGTKNKPGATKVTGAQLNQAFAKRYS
jgi:hypothetical protein